MLTEAQTQRYDYNRACGRSIHYHGYAVQSVQYHTVYRAGSESLVWQCRVGLPYTDLSAADILADARQLWARCAIMQGICRVQHIGQTATVDLGGGIGQTFVITDLGQTDSGMTLVLECRPVGDSPLWGLSAHDIQGWLDRTACTDR